MPKIIDRTYSRLATWNNVEVSQGTSLMDGKWERPTVNWMAIGSVSRDRAIVFAGEVAEAIALAADWDRERTGRLAMDVTSVAPIKTKATK